MNESPYRAFATALSSAMARRGLSDHDVAKALYRQGKNLSTAKLRNWRMARALPRRPSTHTIVSDIENILHLDEGELLIPLRCDLLAEYADANGLDPRPSFAEPRNNHHDVTWKFSSLDKDTDWAGEVHREVMEEEIIVSEDFRHVRMKISLVVRYGANPRPTLHVSSFWDTVNWPEESDIGVYEIRGATVGKVREEQHEEGVSKTATLHLPPDVPEGQLRRVYYEQGYTSAEPLDIAVLRAFSWPIHHYTGRVSFEGALPDNIRWVLAHIDEDESKTTTATRQLTAHGKTVQTSYERLSNATGSFQWDMPVLSR